jgi:hypothetical protein
MNRIAFIALALLPALLLCSCGSSKGKKKKKDPMSQTLGQRLDRPDMTRQSSYQKYMDNSKDSGSMGSHFQKKSFRSSNFAADKKAGGMSQAYKTDTAKGFGASSYADSKFAQSDKGSLFTKKEFGTGSAFDAGKGAPSGNSVFSGANDVFGTRSALPKSLRTARPEKIIEERGSNTNQAYSEEDVKRLLGRP